MAIIYHQLGMTAQRRGRLYQAEDWYRKCLTIEEELGNRPGMATAYHSLGITAQDRGRLDEAEDWYRQSLTINEELGDRLGMALTYAQLGLLAEDRAQARLALEWNIRCVTLFDQFPSPLTGHRATALARLTRQLGLPALEASLAADHRPARAAAGTRLRHQPPRRRSAWRHAMTDPAADAARSAAAILTPDLGPNLPAEVEAALAARDTQQRPDRYLDPVSLASLIVAIATLAWTIYNDQRDRTTPTRHPAPSHARSASPSATRTWPCPPAPSASPKWSPPRSPARPGLPPSQARNPKRLAPDVGAPFALPSRRRARGLSWYFSHPRIEQFTDVHPP